MKDLFYMRISLNIIMLGMATIHSYNKTLTQTYECHPQHDSSDTIPRIFGAIFPIVYLDDPQFIEDYCENK